MPTQTQQGNGSNTYKNNRSSSRSDGNDNTDHKDRGDNRPTDPEPPAAAPSPPQASTMATASTGSVPASLVFDASVLQHRAEIPAEFVWPDEEKPTPDAEEELNVPVVDLEEVLSSCEAAGEGTMPPSLRMVREACEQHGFFQVVNHGVDREMLAEVHRHMEEFFGMPLEVKMEKARRRKGESCGYASSFTGRFASKLPWKETLSFRHRPGAGDVKEYFVNTLGEAFRHHGNLFQAYCDAMSRVSMRIMELLGASLGVGRRCYAAFFEGHDSIMRLNYYPPCRTPQLTLGTGPHCDPTSLTILHQDHVAGLQVFTDRRWRSVRPNPDAFVVNIGDTFMALSNGHYKSCLHRAVVNSDTHRRSLAFFLSPDMNKLVVPTPELVGQDQERRYPDFTWGQFLHFTQNHYRADGSTLDAFVRWLAANSAADPDAAGGSPQPRL